MNSWQEVQTQSNGCPSGKPFGNTKSDVLWLSVCVRVHVPVCTRVHLLFVEWTKQLLEGLWQNPSLLLSYLSLSSFCA